MNLYENYHSKRKLQKRSMSDDDFTYGTIITFLNKYGKRALKILDIGCGVGTTSLFLAAKGKDVVGIDISRSGIIAASKNAKHLKLEKHIKFSVMDFPYLSPKGKFDLIVCSEVLEHIKDDKIAVEKIYKLLNKHGFVIASSPSSNAPLYRLGLLNKFDKEVGHLRRYTEDSFKILFKKVGFRIIETKKTEGIVRNFLFTNSFGGFLLKFIKRWPFSKAATAIDNLMIRIVGESDLYVIAQKI